ncbi:MAG: hypothetical protein VB912_16335 [Pirellulaceae bacterium]
MFQRCLPGQQSWVISLLVLTACVVPGERRLLGQQERAPANHAAQESLPATGKSNKEAMSDLLMWIARQHMPTTYQDKKEWGGTREIVTGLKIVGKGRKLSTAPRRKRVNHGTWKMYQVSLKDPQDGFHIELNRVQVTEEKGLVFEAIIEARLEMLARWAQWNRGVQLISLNALVDAKVRLQLAGNLAIRIDPLKLPPEVTVIPSVTSAHLQLKSFRLLRISQLHGSLVHAIGREARKTIEKQLAAKQGDLVARINQQIERNQEKLRLSLSKYLQQEWVRLMSNLPEKELR